MSSERDEASLLDILRAGERVLKFSQELSRADLETSELHQSAILYQIGIVGEATKRLSPEFIAEHPDLPWSEAAKMRDIVFHKYDGINLDIVWIVIKRSIPEYIEAIAPLVPRKRDR